MKVSQKGILELVSHEAIVLSRYRDSVGVWTFGIGHTKGAGAPDPQFMRGEYTLDYAMEVFRNDLAKYEFRVNQAFTRTLTQMQFDAAVSFDFNTGGINDSTWVKRFNAGDIAGARQAFMWWKKPSSIIERRQKECDLFFLGEYSNAGYVNTYPASPSGRVLWHQGRRIKLPEPNKPSRDELLLEILDLLKRATEPKLIEAREILQGA